MVFARVLKGEKLNGQAIQTLVTLQSTLLAAGVCAAMGRFSGACPAARAARMSPIEALQDE
jgi:ABC-type lipoprotein release transport system permease subunit